MTDYYFDYDLGNDSNPGTIAEPKKTVGWLYNAFASNLIYYGDGAWFRRGRIWPCTSGTERFRVRQLQGAGSWDNCFWLGDYGEGELPRFNGGGALGSVLLGAWDETTSYVRVRNLWLYDSTAQQIGLASSSHHWWFEGVRAGRDNGHWNQGNPVLIRGNAHHLWFDGCEFTSHGATNARSCFYVGTATDPDDRPNRIFLRNSILRDSSEELIDLKPGSEFVVVEFCDISNPAYGSDGCVSVRGLNHQFRYNLLDANGNSRGFAGWISYDRLHDCEFVFNLVYNATQGLRLDGTGHKVRSNTFGTLTDACVVVNGNSWVVKGNAFYGAVVGLQVQTGVTIASLDSDYNGYYQNISQCRVAGVNRTAAWMCTNYGKECNSKTANPEYESTRYFWIPTDSVYYHADQDGLSIGYHQHDDPVAEGDEALQGLWLLDEASGTREDDSGNENDLTDYNTVGSATDAQRGERSADFESGNSEYLGISDAAQAGLDPGGPCSFGLWFKAESAATHNLLTKYNTTGNQRGYLLYADASGVIGCYFSGDGSTYTLATTAAGALPLDVWTHVVVVYNGSVIRIYVNGVLARNGTENPKTYSAGVYNNTAAFLLGLRDGLTSNYADGKMGEVFFLDRALGAPEVETEYRQGFLETVAPGGIASGEAFGTATISGAPPMIQPGGIASGEAVGMPNVPGLPATIEPAGVASGEAFGTAGLGITVEVSVAASSDDAEQGDSAVLLTGTYIRWYQGSTCHGGFRVMLPSTIPQGSMIVSATFKYKYTDIAFDTFTAVVWAHDAANPGTFTTATNDISSRPATTAQENINDVDAGTDWIELDVTDVLQELADDYDIQAVAIIVYDATSDSARWITYDGSTVNCPKLKIVYIPAVTQTIMPGGIASLEAFGDGVVAPGAVTVQPGGVVSGEAVGSQTVAPGVAMVEPDSLPLTWAVGDSEAVPGAVAITPEGLISGEALGTHTFLLYVLPAGITSGEVLGTAVLGLYVTPGGIVSGEALGMAQLNLAILPAGVVSGEAIGAATVAITALIIEPGGIGSGEALGTAVLGLYVTPAGVASGEALGAATVTPGVVVILPAGVASGEGLGMVTLGLYVTPGGILSGEALGVARLGLYVTPGGILSGEALGVARLGLYVTPGGILSGEALGAVMLGLYVTSGGIGSGEALGAAVLGLAIVPAGIGSGEGIGAAQLNLAISATGIGSGEALGAATVAVTALIIEPGGIGSGEALGLARLGLYVTPAGVASGEALGLARLGLYVTPAGVASGEALGLARLGLYVTPAGITSLEALGAARLGLYVTPAGITSLEALGAARLGLYVTPAGITSLEALGAARLGLYVTPAGITSLEALGAARLGLYVTPAGITSLEVLGAAQLGLYVTPAGITSLEALGVVQLGLYVTPAGITSLEALGAARLGLYVTPAGITSLEALGAAQLGLYVTPAGIASLEALGAARLGLYVTPAGVTSGEALGAMTVVMGSLLQMIMPGGVASLEGIGEPALGLVLRLVGVGSGEVVGAARVILDLILVALGDLIVTGMIPGDQVVGEAAVGDRDVTRVAVRDQ